MVRKIKSASRHEADPQVYVQRVQTALDNGRFQTALELSKQLFKQVPSVENRQLLLRAQLGRARELREVGYLQDAIAVLNSAASNIQANQHLAGEVALEFAWCGGAQKAIELSDCLGNPALSAQVLSLSADMYLVYETPFERVPDRLRDGIALVRQAFKELEAGQDELAGESLQKIGLQSPFMEWKLLARGLMAYYARDDERAIANWRRMDAERVPGRIAAIFRNQIDKAFRESQPTSSPSPSRQLIETHEHNSLLSGLRHLQAVMADDRPVQRGLRLLEGLIPELRKLDPDLVRRVVLVYLGFILDVGSPKDLDLYSRTAHYWEPSCDLLRRMALMLEERGLFHECHAGWQAYESLVAQHPEDWPSGAIDHVRALIWHHIGVNATTYAHPDNHRMSAARNHDQFAPMPPADECFRRAIELNPGHLESHQALVEYLTALGDDDGAQQAARRLLEAFPTHVPTLVRLASAAAGDEQYEEAIQFYQRALEVNPLDRKIREALKAAHVDFAEDCARDGRFDDAGRHFKLGLHEGKHAGDADVLCRWAAVEFKAGNAAAAEQLLARARELPVSALRIAHVMAVASVRMSLTPKLKKRFSAELKAGLAGPPTAQAVVELTSLKSARWQSSTEYPGKKSHHKAIKSYITAALEAEFTESQMLDVCRALLEMQDSKALTRYCRRAQRLFPQNPWFPLLNIEGRLLPDTDPGRIWELRDLLDTSSRLAKALPNRDQEAEILQRVQTAAVKVAQLNPFGASFFGLGRLINAFGAVDDEDDMD